MNAIDSGTIAAQVAPETRRAAPSMPRLPARPAALVVKAEARVIRAIRRILPKRSPSGP